MMLAEVYKRENDIDRARKAAMKALKFAKIYHSDKVDEFNKKLKSIEN